MVEQVKETSSVAGTVPQNTPPVTPTVGGVNVSVGTAPNAIPIPADYKALGVTSGYNPRPPEQLRLFIVGPPGEGKSTFISSIPDTLILDFETGADAVPNGRAARVRIKNYAHYKAIIDQLVKDGKQGRVTFKRVAFDTVDEWAALIATQLGEEKGVENITEFGSKGHGWSLIKNRAWGDVRELEAAGFIWCCLGHMTEKTVTSPVDHKETTVIRALLFDSFAKTIQRNSDVYGTVYNVSGEQIVKQQITLPGGQVRIVEKKLPITVYKLDLSTVGKKEGKLRGVPKMPRELELPAADGWGVFADAYNEAVAAEKNGK